MNQRENCSGGISWVPKIRTSGERDSVQLLRGTGTLCLSGPGAHFSNVPKSYFKNPEAFDVQSFLCQQVLHLSKAYTYATFRI